MLQVALIIAFLFSARAEAATETELLFRAHARAHVQAEATAGRTQDLVLHALDALMAKAHARLRGEGFGPLADQLEGEWIGTYRQVFTAPSGWIVSSYPRNVRGGYDMGRHAPASAWVAEWYAQVEARLGVTVCEFLHLRDVYVINYGWPVVTNAYAATAWCLELAPSPGDSCAAEYGRHFTGTKWQALPDPYADPIDHWGVLPVAAWWVTEVACEVGLWGADGSFLCGSAASVVEIATARWVAPPIAKKIWDRNNAR